MFLTVHAAAAVVISETISSRLAGFLLGIISHLILDFFPHGDYGMDKWIDRVPRLKLLRTMIAGLIDISVLFVGTLLAIYYLPVSHPEVVVWTAFGAILPDLVWGLYVITGKRIKPLGWLTSWHHASQNIWKDRLPFKKGLAIQILVLFLLLMIQIKLLH